jgi:hypothetical protein
MPKYLFKLLFFAFFFGGCTVNTPSLPNTEIIQLATLLQRSSPLSTYSESLKLSQDIFTQIKVLNKVFQRTTSPKYHNFLITLGLKKKGLCYHWSDALYHHFKTQKSYPSFTFHLMVSNKGSYWKEHNTLVIVPIDQAIEEGVIIDPWRDTHQLYFSKVKDDTDYHWIHRKERGCKDRF